MTVAQTLRDHGIAVAAAPRLPRSTRTAKAVEFNQGLVDQALKLSGNKDPLRLLNAGELVPSHKLSESMDGLRAAEVTRSVLDLVDPKWRDKYTVIATPERIGIAKSPEAESAAYLHEIIERAAPKKKEKHGADDTDVDPAAVKPKRAARPRKSKAED